jgi:hypothetical protein
VSLGTDILNLALASSDRARTLLILGQAHQDDSAMYRRAEIHGLGTSVHWSVRTSAPVAAPTPMPIPPNIAVKPGYLSCPNIEEAVFFEAETHDKAGSDAYH